MSPMKASRVSRGMLIRIVRFCRSTSDGVPLHATESNGLLMDFLVSRATGTAERDAVPVMLDDARQRGYRPRTLGGDKGYDTRECVRAMRNRGVTPHVARRTHSAIDGRTTRHASYRASQKVRKRVEEVFGSMKTVGGLRRTRYRGVERTGLGWILRGHGLQSGEDG